MKLYICILIGQVLFILFQFNEAKALPNFSGKYFLKKNWFPTLINLACGFALVYADVPNKALDALAIGAGGQAFFKKLMNLFDPDKATYVNNVINGGTSEPRDYGYIGVLKGDPAGEKGIEGVDGIPTPPITGSASSQGMTGTPGGVSDPSGIRKIK